MGAAVGAEGVEEALQDPVVAALGYPDDPAVVVVGDHGQVVVAPLVGDLIDTESVGVVEPVVVQVVGHDTRHGAMDGLPRDP